MLRLADLAERPDFQLGDLSISPGRRRVTGPDGSKSIEPQFMFVFLRLLDAAGVVVTRAELFEQCWGGTIVGDDSLNRAIAGARQIANGAGSDVFVIETIPRTGYMLTLKPGIRIDEFNDPQHGEETRLQRAIEEAYDCWRTGLPAPDLGAIDELKAALAGRPGDARGWGMYALVLRKAAEYAKQDDCANFVRSCEQAARRAFALELGRSDAAVALAGVVPIFGNWLAARHQLLAVLEADQDHVPAAHDLAILEMSTGRPSAAKPVVEALIARDPLAATFHYKRMYHLWTFGETPELERVATRALQLWPRHPAIWAARFWTLLFTGRAAQSMRMLDDVYGKPPMPAPAIALLRAIGAVAVNEQEGSSVDVSARNSAVAMALAAASRGPAHAVAGLISLLALDAIDEAFQVANGYYLGVGGPAVPVRWHSEDPSITDQHRRVTQPLFIPAAARMRDDPRFPQLCRDIGLEAYWEQCGLTPDFAA